MTWEELSQQQVPESANPLCRDQAAITARLLFPQELVFRT